MNDKLAKAGNIGGWQKYLSTRRQNPKNDPAYSTLLNSYGNSEILSVVFFLSMVQNEYN